MDFTASGRAVYVTLIEEFRQYPPRFFTADSSNRVFRHDPRQINVCDRSSDAMFPESMGGVLVVSNEDGLQQLMARLLDRPMFFTVSIERSYKEFCSNVTHRTRGRLAVFVNTQHPHARHLIQSQLAQGMDVLRRGKKFAVEFNFNDVITSWMKTVYRQEDMQISGCGASYSCSSGKVTVTNYSEFEEIFKCNSFESLAMFIVCFPCCLVTFPCYMIHRSVTVADYGGDVEGLQASYWSASAEQEGMAEVLNRVLQLIAQENVGPVRTRDMPPTYEAATGTNLSHGGPQVMVQQPGYSPGCAVQVAQQPAPVAQQPVYAQVGVRQPGHPQPLGQQPGHPQSMGQQPGHPQPMGQQPGYPQPMGQQPGYTRPVTQ